MADVYGVDISYWQNRVYENGKYVYKPIDFVKMRSKAHFAFIRSSYGIYYQDIAFDMNWSGAKDAGMARASYHYLILDKEMSSARRQADNYWSVIREDVGELDLCFADVEKNDNKLTRSEAQDFIWEFIQKFKDNSGKPISIYTSPGFWNGNVTYYGSPSKIPIGRTLWVASWTGASEPGIPYDWEYRYPKTWERHPLIASFWQWSNLGKGIDYGVHSKTIDLNRYNGTLDQFNQRFGLNFAPIGEDNGVIPPPPPDQDVIRIAHLESDETLRIRSQPWGTIVGMTWNGAMFDVVGSKHDANNRLWFRIGGANDDSEYAQYVASWYTEEL